MPCSHQGCPGDAAYRPVLQTRSRAGRKTTCVTFCQLGYCESHRASYTVENLLSSEGHTKLAKFVREKGLPEPEHKLTTLGWKVLTPDDLEDLLQNQQYTMTNDEELAF